MLAFGMRVVPVIPWSLLLLVLAAMPRNRPKAVEYFDEILPSCYAAQPELDRVIDPNAAPGSSLGRGVPFSAPLVSYRGMSLLRSSGNKRLARCLSPTVPPAASGSSPSNSVSLNTTSSPSSPSRATVVGPTAGGSPSGAIESSAEYDMPDLSSTFDPGAMSTSTGAVSTVSINRKGKHNASSSSRSAPTAPSATSSAFQVADPGTLSTMIGAMSTARHLSDVMLDPLGDGPTGPAASRPASSSGDGAVCTVQCWVLRR